ncbi:unnamed protein product [Ranitomeya imitator]|uniref:Centrosomal protein CEP104 Zn finger domain-containing protein n=1 Tax=Ranitomeya imitator TaxID=111125 RepID=A0ABN9LPV4_9NEOB|nr:unnamed protein product [Ranitomeya imitator]
MGGISPDYLSKLTARMPKVCNAVIAAKEPRHLCTAVLCAALNMAEKYTCKEVQCRGACVDDAGLRHPQEASRRAAIIRRWEAPDQDQTSMWAWLCFDWLTSEKCPQRSSVVHAQEGKLYTILTGDITLEQRGTEEKEKQFHNQQKLDEVLDLCIFCGERDESFTEEGLDLHYWKQCPMLKRCEHCKQVVEIASLTDHLLTECDHKDLFGKCQRCTEAISKDHLLEHVKAKTCNPAKGEKVANRCPLCHENFTPGEEAWKSHLMGKDGCKMNPRRILALQRTQAAAQATNKVGGATGAKGGTTGAKQRPPIAGSRIPAPRAGLNKTASKPQR